MWGDHRSFTAWFLREIFGLKSPILSEPASALWMRRLECSERPAARAKAHLAHSQPQHVLPFGSCGVQGHEEDPKRQAPR